MEARGEVEVKESLVGTEMEEMLESLKKSEVWGGFWGGLELLFVWRF